MAAARIIPNPMVKIMTQIKIYGSIKKAHVIFSPVISAAMISGINDISKLIPEEKTLVTGYIYFGKYTFVINGAFPTIDFQ